MGKREFKGRAKAAVFSWKYTFNDDDGGDGGGGGEDDGDGSGDEHLGWVGGEGCWGGLVVAYGSLKGILIEQTERGNNCASLNISFAHEQAQWNMLQGRIYIQ